MMITVGEMILRIAVGGLLGALVVLRVTSRDYTSRLQDTARSLSGITVTRIEPVID